MYIYVYMYISASDKITHQLTITLECPTSERFYPNIANNPLVTKPNAFALRVTQTNDMQMLSCLCCYRSTLRHVKPATRNTICPVRISPVTTAVARTFHVTVNQVTSNLYAKQPTLFSLKAYESEWLLRAQKDSVSYPE